jgi:hypothetical protein
MIQIKALPPLQLRHQGLSLDTVTDETSVKELTPRRSQNLLPALAQPARMASSNSTELVVSEITPFEKKDEIAEENLRHLWKFPNGSKTYDLDSVTNDTEIKGAHILRHKKKSASLRSVTPLLSTLDRCASPAKDECFTRQVQRGARSSSQSNSSHRSTVLKLLGLSSVDITASRAEAIRGGVSPVRQSTLQSNFNQNHGPERSFATSFNGSARFPSLHNMKQQYRASSEPYIMKCKVCGKKKRT